MVKINFTPALLLQTMENQDPNQSSEEPNNREVSQLLRLKRYEKPSDDAYFDNFLSSFQERQRSEMLNQSARGLLAERVATWWWDGGKKWIYGAGAVSVTAAVAMGVFASNDDDENANLATDTDMIELDLDIKNASTRPPAMPATSTTNQNGFIPVSTNSLQEL